jgi:hypothetical protein
MNEVVDPDGDNELEECVTEVLLTDEEKREVAIASKRAHTVYKDDLMVQCQKLIGDDQSKHWKLVMCNKNEVALDEWEGKKRSQDSHLRIFRVKGKLNVPTKRVLRMCSDFNAETRPKWDTLINGDSIKTLEKFDDNFKIIEWCSNLPSSFWGAAWNKRSVCIVATGDNWCMQQELPSVSPKHRNATPGPPPINHTEMNGDWSILFMPNETQAVMIVAIDLPRSTSSWIPFISTQTSEDWVCDKLLERFSLLESVNSNYSHYYI